MKRAIWISVGLISAIILFDRFFSPRNTVEKQVELFQTNATAPRPFPSRSPHAVEISQNELTELSSTNHEKDGTEWKKLSREQIEAYLLKTKRSPESLINAFLETGDTNFLAEAVKNSPDNPIVQWEMLSQSSPEERGQWLEKLKISSPDNALPNYLSALDYLKSGDPEKAIAEMDAAAKKSYNSFDVERMQSREEMYLLAGYSPLEAKLKATESLLLPNLVEMKTMAQQISELQKKYLAAGDVSSAQQLGALGIEAGRKLESGENTILISQLVGFAMENLMLNHLNPGTQYDFLGKTAGERAQEIKNQREEIKELVRENAPFYERLSEPEKLIYLDRRRIYGEVNAMRWLQRIYNDRN